jgi:hypothetical protein
MTIKWRIPPSSFLDEVEIEKVYNAARLLKLEYGTAIECYSMSPDGPTVSSIFLASDDYLCEVHLRTKHQEFDVSAAHTVLNYRLKIGESVHGASVDTVDLADISAAVLLDSELSSDLATKRTLASSKIKFVEVTLKHTEALASQLSYFGDDIDDWLAYFLEAYPTKFLLR